MANEKKPGNVYGMNKKLIDTSLLEDKIEPNPEVVSFCTQLLKMANSGYIQEIITIVCMSDDSIQHDMIIDDSAYCVPLFGEIMEAAYCYREFCNPIEFIEED